MNEYEIKAREIIIGFQFQKEPLNFEQAKYCALKAVDITIEQLSILGSKFSENFFECYSEVNNERNYWENIKLEIKNL